MHNPLHHEDTLYILALTPVYSHDHSDCIALLSLLPSSLSPSLPPPYSTCLTVHIHTHAVYTCTCTYCTMSCIYMYIKSYLYVCVIGFQCCFNLFILSSQSFCSCTDRDRKCEWMWPLGSSLGARTCVLAIAYYVKIFLSVLQACNYARMHVHVHGTVQVR